MRHFAGVLLGIVLIPAYFALNWALNYIGGQVAGGVDRWWLVLLLVAYGVFGALTGIVLAWRSISPTALLVAGVVLIAIEVMLALPVLAGLKLNLPELYAHPNITDGRLLVAAGVALVVGGVLPTRWHRPVRGGVAEPEELDDDHRYAGAELLPGGPPVEEEAPISRYDASWGTGRNDHIDEPEQPYTQQQAPQESGSYPPAEQEPLGYPSGQEYAPDAGYQQEPATHEFPPPEPETRPGGDDQPPPRFSAQYDPASNDRLG